MAGAAAPTRRRFLTLVGIAATAAAIPTGAFLLRDGNGDDDQPAGAETAQAARSTTEVVRRDLVSAIEVGGSVGYGERQPVAPNTPGGTITRLPAPGTVVEVGQALYDVDGRAGPVLLVGTLPMWRSLESSSSDGPDVRQLEQNLVDLGYGNGFVVNDEYTDTTADAVRAWQKDLGREATGRVDPADVWYAAGKVRVAQVPARLGGPSSGEVLQVTGVDRLVHVDLDAKHGAYAVEGSAVRVEVGDTTVDGTITSVASTATVTPGANGQAGTATIALEVTPAEAIEALDESPATVHLATDTVEGALAVPVEAVVAVAGGGYAVEVVRSGSTTDLVAVELGRFADGFVQITGSVDEGDTVVTA